MAQTLVAALSRDALRTAFSLSEWLGSIIRS